MIITQAKPQIQVAEIQVSYKNNTNPDSRVSITSSRTAYDVLLKHWDEGTIEFVEEFKVILLNRTNQVLGVLPLAKGGTSAVTVDIKVIFATALKAASSAIILAHNHPSGGLSPSDADNRLTKKLAEAGKFLDIQVLDHLIVTNHGYYSFVDDGAL